MPSWDPALVVGLGTRCHSRAILADDRSLVSGIDGLGAARRLLRALTALAASLLLREQRGNPGIVDEVAGAAKSSRQKQVQKDSV